MRLFAGRKAAKKRGAGGLIGWIVGSDGSAMQVPGYTRLIDCRRSPRQSMRSPAASPA